MIEFERGLWWMLLFLMMTALALLLLVAACARKPDVPPPMRDNVILCTPQTPCLGIHSDQGSY